MLWTACDDNIVVALSRAYVYVIGPNWLIECPLGNSTDDRAYPVLIMLRAKWDGERDLFGLSRGFRHSRGGPWALRSRSRRRGGGLMAVLGGNGRGLFGVLFGDGLNG